MSKTMPLKPRMTEKTYALSAKNVYVFDVPVSANKSQVTSAVEAQFEVKVEDTRLLVLKGKKARSIRIGARYRSPIVGQRPDVKKAYVTVKEGNKIPIFDAIEEAEKKAEKAEGKAAKKTAKSKTEEKPKVVKETQPEEKRRRFSLRGRKGGDK